MEKALLEHPGVLETAVFGVPHARLGESVAAAVVPKPGSTVSVQELTSFLAARIARFKIPHGIQVLGELPRGPTGKVLRPRLAEQHMQERPLPTQPASLIEMEVLDLWRRLLRRTDEISVDDDFYDMGGGPAVLTIRSVADAVADGLPQGPAMVTSVKQGFGIPLFFCHGNDAARACTRTS